MAEATAGLANSSTELQREQIVNSSSSQLEAPEKNWFRPCSLEYRVELKSCAISNGMEKFWAVVEKGRKKGNYIDEKTFLYIYSKLIELERDNDAKELKLFYEKMILEIAIERAVKLVAKNSDWGGELETKLGENSISVQEHFVLGVLEGLRKKDLPLKALIFFKWVGESLGFEHNSVTHNGILRCLCREEAITEFWSMFKGMKDAGYVVDTDTYVQVMREFRKRKMVKDAVELFEHRMDSPFQYLPNDCSLLLRGIASTLDPDLDLMSRVVKKYEAAGYCLLKSDYEGIHRCLSSAGKFDEAEKVIQTMKRAGYEPSHIIHKNLIYGLCKARRLEEACEVLDAMKAQGCIPDIETWVVLIRCCCDVDGVDKALPWFGKMVKQGFDADAGLLDVLVNGFLKEKRVIEGYQFVLEMVDKAHAKPWLTTLNNLIEELLGERRLEEALNLLRLVKKRNYKPDPEPFVQYISKFGSVEDAWAFLRTLSKKQSKKHVSVFGCQRIFHSFFNESRHSEAEELFLKCPKYIRKDPAFSVLFASSGSSNAVAASA